VWGGGGRGRQMLLAEYLELPIQSTIPYDGRGKKE
jgi:hypothetical protein